MALLVWYKGGVWTIEQPRGSLLKEHPAMQTMIHLYQMFKGMPELHSNPVLVHSLHLGDFGAPTEKPVMLYSSETLELTAPKTTRRSTTNQTPLAVTYFDKSGERRCTGTPALKQSQQYPPAFHGC